MRISAKGEYATKAVLYLSLKYPHVVTIHEIAEGHRIPLKYLEQILLALKQNGMLESRRGVHGGYMLARAPEQISVGDVLRAVDGSFSQTTCLRGARDDEYACPEGGSCGLRGLWAEVQATVDRMLFDTSFADVCRRTIAGAATGSKTASPAPRL